jgi:hypothetical protein
MLSNSAMRVREVHIGTSNLASATLLNARRTAWLAQCAAYALVRARSRSILTRDPLSTTRVLRAFAGAESEDPLRNACAFAREPHSPRYANVQRAALLLGWT